MQKKCINKLFSHPRLESLIMENHLLAAREYERYLLTLLFDTAIQKNDRYQPRNLDEYFVFKIAAAMLDGYCKPAGEIWWTIVDNSHIQARGFQMVIPFGKIASLLPISLKHGIPAF